MILSGCCGCTGKITVQVSEINDSVFDVSWKQHRNLKYFSKQMNSLYKEEYCPPIKKLFCIITLSSSL